MFIYISATGTGSTVSKCWKGHAWSLWHCPQRPWDIMNKAQFHFKMITTYCCNKINNRCNIKAAPEAWSPEWEGQKKSYNCPQLLIPSSSLYKHCIHKWSCSPTCHNGLPGLVAPVTGQYHMLCPRGSSCVDPQSWLHRWPTQPPVNTQDKPRKQNKYVSHRWRSVQRGKIILSIIIPRLHDQRKTWWMYGWVIELYFKKWTIGQCRSNFTTDKSPWTFSYQTAFWSRWNMTVNQLCSLQ